MRRLSFTLGAAGAGQLFQNVLPWLLAILAIAVIGAIVIMFVRRVLRSDSSGDAQGFTLQSLRDLRDQGQISEEEYQRAREAMIGRVKREAEQSKTKEKRDTSTDTETGPASGDSDKGAS